MYELKRIPVENVTFNEGMNISLNPYYGILKTQAECFASDEFTQLNL
jgi:hypothetical protein